MFRKTTTALALVTVVLAAACNSLVGIEEVEDGGPDPRPIADKKNCIEDLRAIDILSPSEAQIVHGGELVLVTFETEWLCGSYDLTLYASYDHGTTFVTVGQATNAASMSWSVPNNAVYPLLKVVAVDRTGSLSDEIALANSVIVRPDQPRRDREPQQRD
jgi:hypothetical protein